MGSDHVFDKGLVSRICEGLSERAADLGVGFVQTAMVDTWLRALVETHRTRRRRVDFTVCKFLKISCGGVDGVQTEPKEDKEPNCVTGDSHYHAEGERRGKALIEVILENIV